MRLRKPSPRTARRALIALALVLGVGGVSLVVYPFATDLWAARIQHGLAGELGAAEDVYRAGAIETGDPLTRMEIPRLDVDTIVVEGTTQSALRAGAGHYPRTPLPGERGNVAIAGHRTTYGRPFNRMDELVVGDRVILTTPVGRHIYEVTTRPWVVDPTDWSPIDDYPAKGGWLTLTSCHPEGSASYRIVVRAELIKSTDSVAFGEAALE